MPTSFATTSAQNPCGSLRPPLSGSQAIFDWPLTPAVSANAAPATRQALPIRITEEAMYVSLIRLQPDVTEARKFSILTRGKLSNAVLKSLSIIGVLAAFAIALALALPWTGATVSAVRTP